MAEQVASLEAKLGANISGLDAGLRKAQRMMRDTAQGFQNAGKAMTIGITLPVLAAGGALTKMAMDAVESENLFEVAMGNMAGAGRAWSKAMKDAYGVSEYNARKYLGTLNMMVAGMGLSEDAAFSLSKSMTELAYDLASVYNVGIDEALLKLQAGLAGETEPLRRWGITILEETVNAWAFKEGLIGVNQEMTQQQKVIARAGLIMELTSRQAGDMARTLESPANQLRIVQERFHDAAIEAGQVFLPMASEALGWLADVGIPGAIGAMDELRDRWELLSDDAKRNLVAVGLLFVAGGPFMTGIGLGLQGVGLLLSAFGMLPLGVKKAVIAAMIILMPLRSGLADMFDNIAKMREFQMGFGHREDWARDAANALRNPLQVGGEAMLNLGDEILSPLLAQAEGMGKEFFAKFFSGGKADPGSLDPEYRAALLMDEQARKADEAAEAQRKLREEFARQGGAAGTAGIAGAKKATDELKSALDAAGISMSEFQSYLVAQHPASLAAAAAVDTLRLRIKGLQDQQEAYNASIEAAQTHLTGLQDHANALSNALSAAQSRLSELTRPRLKGMGEADDQAAWIQRQKQRVEYARKTGMSMEEVLKLFPHLSDAERDFSSGLPNSVKALEKMAEVLALKSGLSFDEALRQIAKSAEDTEEISFADAVAQIAATKAEIAGLSGALGIAQAAVATQEQYIRSLQTAQSELNLQVKAYQEDLTAAEEYQRTLTDALEDAYDWLLRDKDGIENLGDAAVTQSSIVDGAATTILTAFTGLVSSEVAATKAAIDEMVNYFNAAKASLGTISTGYEPGNPESHAIGGIVGGPQGAPRLILAHGGERVQTVAEREGGGGDTITVSVNLPNVRSVDSGNIRALAYAVAGELKRRR